jgi:hypothetical protein
MTPKPPRVPVRATPNRYYETRGYPHAVILTFTEPCPFCDRYHSHGSATGELTAEGTYGHRIEHCSDHTHLTTVSGRRARVTDQNRCSGHGGYILVPEFPEVPR